MSLNSSLNQNAQQTGRYLFLGMLCDLFLQSVDIYLFA